MSKKECKKCFDIKSYFDFSEKKSASDGLQARCKSCISEDSAEYRLANKKSIASRAAKYYSSNKERIANSVNKELKSKYNAEYHQKNKEAIYKRYSEYRKNRLITDPAFALKHRIGTLIRQSITSKSYTKKSLTAEILGCTASEFCNHIERQFTKGMNWKNISKWQIDHIVPVSSGGHDEAEIIRLSHYLNLRPLWAEDNLKKSNKRTYLI